MRATPICLSHIRGRSDSKTAMHKNLSCTLSRLSSSEADAIVRVWGSLPGLHPIHLYWFRTRITDGLLSSCTIYSAECEI